MFPLFTDYFWKEGVPIGIPGPHPTYRIVTDPYRKWITIEAYQNNTFDRLIYDSHLLDFRKMKPTDQAAWRREPLNPHESWIFNEDDRLILREHITPTTIHIFSPHNTPLCHYHLPDGPTGEVTLYDSNQHVVRVRMDGKWKCQEPEGLKR